MNTVLITGGAKRLGKALVEHFSKNGWQVLFTARGSFESGTLLADELGDNVHCIRAECSSQSNAALIAQWVSKYTTSLDLIICNASTFKRLSVVETMPDDFENLLGSNLLGPYYLVQQCLPMLMDAKGLVVNISDAAVNSGVPNFSAYAAAKAGLISITKSMAIELSPNVRVNAILPGSLPWPETTEHYSLELQASMVSEIPLGRIGDWHDIVEAVAYLQNAKFVTGSCMTIDGGRSARY